MRESNTNYTFLDNGSIDIKLKSQDGELIKTDSNIQKDVLKKRSIDSKKSKVRYKNRITGGQNQQGHTSVYE